MLFLYIIILLLKIFENTLSTYRIIVVNKGRKLLSAILQGIITLFWAVSSCLTIVDFKKEPIKVLFLILGASIGSYLGSLIEEKVKKI